jgi:signal transduction histidine kinase
VLREALTNVARHAGATTADVEIDARRDRVTLTVCDDGVGIRSGRRRSGLANLRRRAEKHRGSFTVEAREPAGTRLVWSVPLA